MPFLRLEVFTFHKTGELAALWEWPWMASAQYLLQDFIGMPVEELRQMFLLREVSGCTFISELKN